MISEIWSVIKGLIKGGKGTGRMLELLWLGWTANRRRRAPLARSDVDIHAQVYKEIIRRHSSGPDIHWFSGSARLKELGSHFGTHI